MINNNLALENSGSVETSTTDRSLTTYTFRGGLPSINAPYTKTLNISYRINGVDYEAEGYENRGIY